MKSMKTLKVSVILAGVLMAGTANAFVVDTLIGQFRLPSSGDAAEEAALEGLLGFNVTLDTKVNNANLLAVADGAGQWAIDIAPDTPGYFLLKFGVPGTSSVADTYYFQNTGELSKLVWTDAQVNFITGGDCGFNGAPNSCNISRLSHFTSFDRTGGGGGGGGGDLPEPASLGLVGLALVGAGLASRRRKA